MWQIYLSMVGEEYRKIVITLHSSLEIRSKHPEKSENVSG